MTAARIVIVWSGLSVVLCWAAAALARSPASRTEMEFGLSHEHVTGVTSNWESAYVSAAHTTATRQTFYGMLRETRRFSLYDGEAAGSYYQPLGGGWAVLAEGTVSPTHRVLAKWSATGTIEKQLGGGLNLQLGFRRSEYDITGTDLCIATLEYYWGNFRAAYTFYSGKPDGAGSAPAHRFQVNYYYGDRNSVGIAYATGREVDSLGPLGVLTMEIRSYVISGVHWFDPKWALSFDLVREEQGDLYTRQGARLGIRHAF